MSICSSVRYPSSIKLSNMSSSLSVGNRASCSSSNTGGSCLFLFAPTLGPLAFGLGKVLVATTLGFEIGFAMGLGRVIVATTLGFGLGLGRVIVATTLGLGFALGLGFVAATLRLEIGF